MENNKDEQIEAVEEKLRKEAERKKISKVKTSGKSVFELQKIITQNRKDKTQNRKK